ncbi:MAG: TrkA family potassium uptake protein [Phycisphaerae bacterium]|nr:TrkA family potassium uptake protein [Phycisphaerae bacterium]
MDRFAVIGLGRFGMGLAINLSQKGAEVIAVDLNRDLVEQVRDQVTLAISLDATDADALRVQGIDKVDVAIVGIGQDFEANALATATLKTVGVPKVFARAGSPIQGRILTRIGADGFIFPEAEAAESWAQRLTLPFLMHKIDLGVRHSLVEIKAPSQFVRKTLVQLNLRKRYHVNLVAIKRQVSVSSESAGPQTQQQILDVPMPDSVIQPDDILILIGSDENIARLPAGQSD